MAWISGENMPSISDFQWLVLSTQIPGQPLKSAPVLAIFRQRPWLVARNVQRSDSIAVTSAKNASESTHEAHED